MPRALRLHVPGGLYFIELKRDLSLPPLFVENNEYVVFEQLFGQTLRACSAKAFAFSWEPHTIRFAAQIAHVPISSVVRRLMTAHTRKIRREPIEAGLATARYRALLVDPEPYLFKLVRYVHWSALLGDPTATLDRQAHSSHPFYAGTRSASWLETNAILNQLNHNRSLARYSYIHRMQERPSVEDIRCFEQGGDLDPRILGDEYFIVGLPRRLPVHRSHVTLEQLTDSIAVYCGVTSQELCSALDGPQLPLARALLAWHATHRRIATLTAVAVHLKRKPPTLLSLIKHHKPRNAELFVLGAIPDVRPLTPGLASRAAQTPAVLTQEAAPPCTSLEQIIQWAAREFETTPERICSGSRGDRLSLIRAVIAWQAHQRGIADIKQVAQRMHRSVDALYYGIRHFQSTEPMFFSLDAIPQVTLLQSRAAIRMQRVAEASGGVRDQTPEHLTMRARIGIRRS
jgi:hypothetical protein